MSVDLTQDNYELAKTYDEISDSQYDNGIELIEQLGAKAGDVVLDIGSGTGRLGRYLAAIIGQEGRLIGIDPLEDRVRIANEKNLHQNSSYSIGVAEDLSHIPDQSVNIVILNAVFHWVVDKEKALKEIYRVLKPGGRVGITTGAKELARVSGIQAVTEQVLKRKPYQDVVNLNNHVLRKHGVTTTELIESLTENGLSIKNIYLKSISWPFNTARDLIVHSESSSFGNYLSHVPDTLRDQARADIEIELEKYRTEEGIKIDRHTIFAIAQRGSLN
jgi:ubiquinone/menaquinone biosynthesis C-methylase UbiE